jgi:hypothetical protein
MTDKQKLVTAWAVFDGDNIILHHIYEDYGVALSAERVLSYAVGPSLKYRGPIKLRPVTITPEGE